GFVFFVQAEDGIRDWSVTGVQTCALPIYDAALDHIVTIPPDEVVTRPFEFSTQSETSVVNHGRHIVIGYNTSANQVVQFFPGAEIGRASCRERGEGWGVAVAGKRETQEES